MNRVGTTGAARASGSDGFVIVVLQQWRSSAISAVTRACATLSKRGALAPGMLELAWDGNWYRARTSTTDASGIGTERRNAASTR